ncbi:MAG: hypothetical protein PVF58_22580 [Candidatus Methanofastidiosia archaeon]|jgi:hypothetical protein
MLEKKELKALISLDKEQEIVAREMGILRPLDVLILFRYFWISKLWGEEHGIGAPFFSDEFYNQLASDKFYKKLEYDVINSEKAEVSINRLKRHGLIREVIDGRTEKLYLDMFNLTTKERMGIPIKWKDQMSEKEFIYLL